MELKMMKKPVTTKAPAEQVVKDIRQKTLKCVVRSKLVDLSHLFSEFI
jgi:hypothetical protein